MTELGWVALGLAALAIVLVLLRSRIRARAERLNSEVVRTGATLERTLQGRAVAAIDIARSGQLDPASSVILADIAMRCLENIFNGGSGEYDESPAELRDRALAESELSRGLRIIVPQVAEAAGHDPELRRLLTRLERRWQRANMARTMHNERVAQALRLRNSVPGRLAGISTPVPVTFDMDDAMPPAAPAPR
ncbi:MAG TPA: hypothetical protein VFC82_07385 [Actinomycetaceae bacterium]|nr:hypothetical protein [Actinomycetaceae bacterium]